MNENLESLKAETDARILEAEKIRSELEQVIDSLRLIYAKDKSGQIDEGEENIRNLDFVIEQLEAVGIYGEHIISDNGRTEVYSSDEVLEGAEVSFDESRDLIKDILELLAKNGGEYEDKDTQTLDDNPQNEKNPDKLQSDNAGECLMPDYAKQKKQDRYKRKMKKNGKISKKKKKKKRKKANPENSQDVNERPVFVLKREPTKKELLLQELSSLIEEFETIESPDIRIPIKEEDFDFLRSMKYTEDQLSQIRENWSNADPAKRDFYSPFLNKNRDADKIAILKKQIAINPRRAKNKNIELVINDLKKRIEFVRAFNEYFLGKIPERSEEIQEIKNALEEKQRLLLGENSIVPNKISINPKEISRNLLLSNLKEKIREFESIDIPNERLPILREDLAFFEKMGKLDMSLDLGRLLDEGNTPFFNPRENYNALLTNVNRIKNAINKLDDETLAKAISLVSRYIQEFQDFVYYFSSSRMN